MPSGAIVIDPLKVKTVWIKRDGVKGSYQIEECGETEELDIKFGRLISRI